MTVRQVIGKRRSVGNMQMRGVKRRADLVKAAMELLESNSPQEISLKQIALKAGVPEGSAYHFYANKYDLFIDVAGKIAQEFQIAFAEPIEGHVTSWQDIIGTFIDRASKVYDSNPVARELLIGSKTPPEIKQADDQLAREVAQTMFDRLSDHFTLPEIENMDRILYYMIEVSDVMFSLSMREHGDIRAEYVEEAKRVARGYLGTYLPAVLPTA